MRYLALEKDVPGADAERLHAWLPAEAAAVWTLLKSETLREVWFAMPGRRAVLMLECADEAGARAALGSLPLVREGHIEFELMALRPYDGFERLFQAGPPASP